MNANEVQKIVDILIKRDALEVVIEQGRKRVEKIMTTIVMTLNCSRAIQEADDLMA